METAEDEINWFAFHGRYLGNPFTAADWSAHARDYCLQDNHVTLATRPAAAPINWALYKEGGLGMPWNAGRDAWFLVLQLHEEIELCPRL